MLRLERFIQEDKKLSEFIFMCGRIEFEKYENVEHFKTMYLWKIVSVWVVAGTDDLFS